MRYNAVGASSDRVDPAEREALDTYVKEEHRFGWDDAYQTAKLVPLLTCRDRIAHPVHADV